MLNIRYRTQFKKDYKKIIKRGYSPDDMSKVLTLLVNQQPLPAKYRDHALAGNYIGFRECHIAPDWLLIYKIENDILTLTLTRTGSHSDLF